jgi:hypothetical protein
LVVSVHNGGKRQFLRHKEGIIAATTQARLFFMAINGLTLCKKVFIAKVSPNL